MKVLVSQLGARHHYAIPRMLQNAGMLHQFYTDSCASKGAGKLIGNLLPEILQSPLARKLISRRLNGVPPHKIRVADELLFLRLMNLVRRPRSSFSESYDSDNYFDRLMCGWGTGEANTLYAMLQYGTRFLKFAKSNGLNVAVDMFITPMCYRIIREERERFPGWETDSGDESAYFEKQVEDILEIADLITCPGDNVVDGVRQLAGGAATNVAVVPYGCGIDFGGAVNTPIPGRVLFAGSANLRKGVHYLALASQRLRQRGCNFDFRVAGDVSDLIRSRPECDFLNFLGRVPRPLMRSEFLSADILVLPTLAEGSASVVSEAIMAGLPVITTRAAGSIIRDGVGGWIVPERDPYALADAIELAVTDRAYREVATLSGGELRHELTEGAWQDRLVSLMTSSFATSEVTLKNMVV